MKTIELINARARKPEWSMAEPVNFCSEEGEHIAIIGRNGAGKTMFVDMLTGKHPVFPDMVRYGFDEPYNKLNQMEIDEETPTVGSKLEEAYQLAGDDTPERRALQKHIYEIFHLEPLLDKYIILLSSGELRKYKLASSLFTNPKVLIMENPFIGLDKETREQLKELLGMLAHEQGLQIILVLAKTDEIPEFITHIVEVKDSRVMPKVNSGEWRVESGELIVDRYDYSKTQNEIQKESSLLGKNEQGNHNYPLSTINYPLSTINCQLNEVIHFNHVTIHYGARTILKDLDWTVMQGEHWALSGQNGSGKSTLLSLVCADNPQSYACDISLFGHKRGSGESIWDIKRHIGYVSPEMHRSYKQNIPSIEIVASGLFDTVGLYQHPKDYKPVFDWMERFKISDMADKIFTKLSDGEQRMILLARAFVKNPELLVLDEPFHGLDDNNRHMAKCIIDEYCKDRDKTLIMVSHYDEDFPTCITHKLTLQKND